MIVLEAPRYALAAGVGRPWTTDGSALPIPAAEIHDFAEPGWAMLATDFRFIPVGRRTLISTETRVRTTDADSRRRFALYWFGIRAFSGIIVAALVKSPKQRRRKIVPWSSEEARRFLESARADDDPLYAAYVLVLVLGMRKGEVLGPDVRCRRP